jgi:hypothetical protein
MTWIVYSGVLSNLGIKKFKLSLTVLRYLRHNYMNERK